MIVPSLFSLKSKSEILQFCRKNPCTISKNCFSSMSWSPCTPRTYDYYHYVFKESLNVVIKDIKIYDKGPYRIISHYSFIVIVVYMYR